MNTRREIIKAGAGLAAILATGRAPAAIVRSMLAMRNASAGGRPLPYDSEVEYLESTGTQYIDTGIYATNKTTADFRAMATSSDGLKWIFGARIGWANRSFCLYNGSDNAYRYTFGYGSVSNVPAAQSSVSSKDGLMHDFHIANVCSVDGTALPSWYNGAVTAFSTPHTLRIFGAMVGTTPGLMQYGICRFGFVKIYEGGSLVFDVFPVRFTNADGQAEGAMYDRANPDGGPLGNGLYPSAAANAPFVGACIGPDGTLQIGGGV